MAAREVIHFPLEAQPSTRPQFPRQCSPELVAESPPSHNNSILSQRVYSGLVLTISITLAFHVKHGT